MNTARYIMEDGREAARLARKVDAAAWVAQYLDRLLPDSGAVLEVGCGPGALVAAVAAASSTLYVTGVDLNAGRFRRECASMPFNVSLLEANACALPCEPNAFDVVYCRFLLEYLKERARAVSEMVRVCKPGGRVLLQDLDGQMLWHYPADAELSDQMARVLAFMATTGFDPLVGRKLYSLARDAGLTDLSVQAQPYHLIAGVADDFTLELWDLKLDIALPIAAQALGTMEAARALKARFMDYLRREDSLTYSVVFTVVGTKPGDVSPVPRTR